MCKLCKAYWGVPLSWRCGLLSALMFVIVCTLYNIHARLLQILNPQIRGLDVFSGKSRRCRPLLPYAHPLTGQWYQGHDLHIFNLFITHCHSDHSSPLHEAGAFDSMIDYFLFTEQILTWREWYLLKRIHPKKWEMTAWKWEKCFNNLNHDIHAHVYIY